MEPMFHIVFLDTPVWNIVTIATKMKMFVINVLYINNYHSTHKFTISLLFDEFIFKKYFSVREASQHMVECISLTILLLPLPRINATMSAPFVK